MLRTTLVVVLVAVTLVAGGASADPLARGNEAVPESSAADGDGLRTGPDTDADGLADARERAAGTDQLLTDTDGDGLLDGAEVDEFGTDPLVADSDGDGIADGRESSHYDTDPNRVDSDGDGLDDGVEVSTDPAMSAADPARFDVFVELDYMIGEKPSEEALDRLLAAFADAPVENPDGSTGVALHVVVDDAIPRETGISFAERDRMMRDHMDYDGTGYRYAVAVVDAAHGSKDVYGFASVRGNNGAMVVERFDRPQAQANHFMHELGHSLGLGPSTFRGIDSTDLGYGEYASVMNYNSGRDVMGFSSGPPFDDWAYIGANVYTPSTEAVDASGRKPPQGTGLAARSHVGAKLRTLTAAEA
jgi:hypothetical protein